MFFVFSFCALITGGYALLWDACVDKTCAILVLVDNRRWINRERNTSYILYYHKARYVLSQAVYQE
jgi:hypothetical protein